MTVQELSPQYWKSQIEACATTNLRNMMSRLSKGVAVRLKAKDQSIVQLVKEILQAARTTTLNQSFSEIKLSIVEPTKNLLEGISLIAEGFFDTVSPTIPPQVTEYREAFEGIQKALVSEGADIAREKFKMIAKKILQKEISAEPFSDLELDPPEIDSLVLGWATALGLVLGHFHEDEGEQAPPL